MRHRMGGLENVCMGLGADNIPYELDNSWSGNKNFDEVADKMLHEALGALFSEIGGFDFKVECNDDSYKITFGFEPAYKHDPYLMCCITSKYEDCYMKKGVADGYYGKSVKLSLDKKIKEDGCDKTFVCFVDKWYPVLNKILKI